MADARAICTDGHEFMLKDFEPEPEVIASLSWCPVMIANAKHGGIVLECGALVFWRRAVSFEPKAKVRRFRREKQLDLFYDTPLDKEPTE